MGNADYTYILQAIKEIPFGVGKKLLCDFLRGNKPDAILRNKLDKLPTYGQLAYTQDELYSLLTQLEFKKYIVAKAFGTNKFQKVYELTKEGEDALQNPQKEENSNAYSIEEETTITEKEKKLFALLPHLEKYTDEQKKAIISQEKNILCVAGAGSGKTTVLTKRIEYLVKYCSVNPNSILAITFTRKARQELQERIEVQGVAIETFNSFCEQILRKYGSIVYGDKQVVVITYKDKIKIIRKALQFFKITVDHVITTYFTRGQQKANPKEKLFAIFLNDMFFLRDYFKAKNASISESQFEEDAKKESSFKMVLGICRYIDAYMRKYGLRDFTDQLLDALQFFQSNPEKIPKYEHILVDEYQDVNETQIDLIKKLYQKHIFCVGDPRQSIFGWRGSQVSHILEFNKEYDNCQVISLTKNFRSTEAIVKLVNTEIRPMNMKPLVAANKGKKEIYLEKCDTQKDEYKFVTDVIQKKEIPYEEIFILARTNKVLQDCSAHFKTKKIPHVLKTDEVKRSVIAKKGEVTLATVHAIKGLEAKMVFVVGCTSTNFPCKGSDHPIIDYLKMDNYNKEEEERRLFYVAMSRAKEILYLTYASRSHTYFITEEMKKQIGSNLPASVKTQKKGATNTTSRLKSWRYEVAASLGMPAYVIMNDTTLQDIVLEKPTTKEELGKISGMGATKVMRYGDAILDVLWGK